MKILKTSSWAALTLALIAGGLLLFWPHKALADNPDLDTKDICVPKTIKNGSRHQVDGWLTASFNDRAHVTLTYTPNGNCVTPAGQDSTYFAGNDTFAKIIDNIGGQNSSFTLADTKNDPVITYDNSSDQDSRVDRLGDKLDASTVDTKAGYGNGPGSAPGWHDAIVDPKTTLVQNLNDAEVTLSFEEHATDFNCASNQNGNWLLQDGGSPNWICIDSGGAAGRHGLIIGVNNFTDNADHNFEWCNDKSRFISNGCLGDYILELDKGKPATKPEDITNNKDVQQYYILNTKNKHEWPVMIAGVNASTGPGGGGSNSTGPADQCLANAAGFSLAWILCPTLDAASGLTSALLNFFEDQLAFSVGQLGNAGVNNIKQSWALVRDVATALVVIALLITIFAQAASFGPFDAYTIRKMLPRIVAAVILIQISWVGVVWLIDLVNAVARGIADLMYFPFGGPDNMDLPKLLNGAHLGDWTSVVDWSALLVGGILAAAFLPTMVALAFGAIIGLLCALLALIFRKILIIVLLIFAPLAILAWVMPGTERYWKLWRENLLKVLFMFPIAVAMIAAGRVFAYVVGTQNNNDLANLFFILVGFFGPLFFLPRTFKWGGQAMSLAGGAITGFGQRTYKASKEPLEGFTKRNIQGRFAKKYVPKGQESSTFGNRLGYSLLGGRVIPTKYRAALLTQSGDKWNEERDAEALALLKRKGETAMKEGYETAVVTDDKTSFAKWDTDARGNVLGKNGSAKYFKQADGTFKDATGTTVTEDEFKDAKKIPVSSYAAASKRKVTGVQAMKQMWVDLADEGESSNEKKMSVRQLIATSSWPEVQGSLSRKGNKVIDSDAWSNSVTTSLEDYPKVLRSRVDATPHIDNAARAELARVKANGTFGNLGVSEKDFISQYRVKYAIEKQMSNEDFQTQSDGFWEEAGRVANLRDSNDNLTGGALEIQNALRQRFGAIHDIGGTAPQQLLGHLIGGGVQKDVDKALGPGLTVKDFVEPRAVSGVTSQKTAARTAASAVIPEARDLTSSINIRKQYKSSILTPQNYTPAGVNQNNQQVAAKVDPSQLAQKLAQALAYGSFSQPEEAEQVRVIKEMETSAVTSPQDKAVYNNLIETIEGAFAQRVEEVTRQAVASGRSPAEVANIRNTMLSRANDKLRNQLQFNKIP
jgi:hypothetical protein